MKFMLHDKLADGMSFILFWEDCDDTRHHEEFDTLYYLCRRMADLDEQGDLCEHKVFVGRPLDYDEELSLRTIVSDEAEAAKQRRDFRNMILRMDSDVATCRSRVEILRRFLKDNVQDLTPLGVSKRDKEIADLEKKIDETNRQIVVLREEEKRR